MSVPDLPAQVTAWREKLLPSLVRHVVPAAVGWLLSVALVARFGDALGITRAVWEQAATAVVTAAWYGVWRVVELYWPRIGAAVLGLGVAGPTYVARHRAASDTGKARSWLIVGVMTLLVLASLAFVAIEVSVAPPAGASTGRRTPILPHVLTAQACDGTLTITYGARALYGRELRDRLDDGMVRAELLEVSGRSGPDGQWQRIPATSGGENHLRWTGWQAATGNGSHFFLARVVRTDRDRVIFCPNPDHGVRGVSGVELSRLPVRLADGSTIEVTVTHYPAAQVEPTPAPVPEPAPNTARIGTATYPLTAVNPTATTNPAGATYPGLRGPDQLVAYTKPLLRTATNAYGAEVRVQAGILGGLLKGQTGGVDIPADGYVLSGHGKADAWLTANALPGRRVELIHVDATPVPAPAPPSTPTPIRRTIALYLKRGSAGSAQLKAAATAGVNQVRVAFLQGDPLKLANWSGSEPVTQLAEACATFRAAGGTVLPSIGGQAGAAPSDATKLTAGVLTFERDIPSDGWDVDVEAKALDTAAYVAAAGRLASGWESTWVTSFVPPGGAPVPLYLAAAKACVQAGLRVQVGQQLYGATREHVSKDAMLRQTQLAVDAVGDPESVLIGMWVGPNVEQWTIPECQSMMAAAVQEWPTIGGCYAWTETGAESPTWAAAMSAVLT